MPLIPWNGPWECINCGTVRFIHDGVCEQCPMCGDEEWDVAAAEEIAASMPEMVENKEEADGERQANSPAR